MSEPRIIRGFIVMVSGDCEGRTSVPGAIFEHRETIPVVYPQNNGEWSGHKPEHGIPINIYLGKPTREDLDRMIGFEAISKKQKKIAELKKQISDLENE